MYEKKREDYAVDLEQFHDLIRQMNEHKDALEKKAKEKSKELKSTNEKLLKLSQCVDKLKNTVANQILSVDDLARLDSEIKGLKEALDYHSAIKKQRKKNLLAHEEELVKVSFEVDAIITNYNIKLMDILDLANLSHKLNGKKACFIKDHLHQQSQKATVGIDLQNDVREEILQTLEEFSIKHSSLKEKFHDELDRREYAEECFKTASAKYAMTKDKNVKCKLAFEADSKSFTETLAVRQTELEKVEYKLNALHNPVTLEEQMAAYEEQCSDLERMRIRYKEENITKKKVVLAEIHGACEAMNKHDKFVAEVVSKARSCWHEKSAEVAKLTLAGAVDKLQPKQIFFGNS